MCGLPAKKYEKEKDCLIFQECSKNKAFRVLEHQLATVWQHPVVSHKMSKKEQLAKSMSQISCLF